MSLKITDKDRGFAELLKRVQAIGKPVVTVGIHADDGGEDHGDGATVLDVAIWNEFGLGVPERSFIRAWYEANREPARKKLAELMALVVAGKLSKEKALEQFGAWAQGGIQQRIADGIPPPNAPSTVKEKGSSKPLINKGQLRASIHYKVNTK